MIEAPQPLRSVRLPLRSIRNPFAPSRRLPVPPGEAPPPPPGRGRRVEDRPGHRSGADEGTGVTVRARREEMSISEARG